MENIIVYLCSASIKTMGKKRDTYPLQEDLEMENMLDGFEFEWKWWKRMESKEQR